MAPGFTLAEAIHAIPVCLIDLDHGQENGFRDGNS